STFIIEGMEAPLTMTLPSQVDVANNIKTYRKFHIWNASDFDLTVTTDVPGRTILIHAGKIVEVEVEWDGVSVSNVDVIGVGSAPAHTLAGFVFGTPGASDE